MTLKMIVETLLLIAEVMFVIGMVIVGAVLAADHFILKKKNKN